MGIEIKLLKMRWISVPLVLCLVACNGGDGGGDGGSPADGLFSAYSAVTAGGYQAVTGEGPGDSESRDRDCGFMSALSREEAEAEVAAAGGQVTLATSTQWCASLPGGSSCLARLGESAFARDVRTNPGRPRADVTLTIGLEADRRAMFDSFVVLVSPSMAAVGNEASAVEPDPQVVSAESCEAPPVSRTAADIDGYWVGLRAYYDPLNKTGYTEPHEMDCAQQHCDVLTDTVAELDFTAFDSEGVWRADQAGVEAGAVMSPDGQALAVWACPDDEPGAGELPFGGACRFYGLNRSDLLP
jgi:hypothetical protein